MGEVKWAASLSMPMSVVDTAITASPMFLPSALLTFLGPELALPHACCVLAPDLYHA